MIQIIGRKSCFETKKAMRYLSERGRDFQFVDLSQTGISLYIIARSTHGF